LSQQQDSTIKRLRHVLQASITNPHPPAPPPPQDKINAFWEITKKELEDRKADMRNKDREMEEAEERHQVEVKVGGRRGWL
jgi:hypothetical protein